MLVACDKGMYIACHPEKFNSILGAMRRIWTHAS
jgi:hypothetical protein